MTQILYEYIIYEYILAVHLQVFVLAFVIISNFYRHRSHNPTDKNENYNDEEDVT